MFPDPDQCQQDAGMLEDGKHARDQSLDLFSWSTPCTTLPPTPTSPHRGTVPRALQTHTTPHKHISTHTTHPDTKTPTTHASPHTSPDTYQHMPQWQHTHMYHVFTDTQTPKGIHRCTWSLPISMQTTTPHIYIQVGAGQLGRRRSPRC